MLNPNAQKWVAALRSGKYEQGKGSLRQGDKFCCLGVGCEVAIENGLAVKVLSLQQYGGKDDAVYEYDEQRGQLPPSVRNWLGLRSPGGSTVNILHGRSLVHLNDSCGKTFHEIADYIESEPEGLFATEAA